MTATVVLTGMGGMRPARRPVPTVAGDVGLSVVAARVAVAAIAAVADGAGRTGRGVVDVTTAVDVRATTVPEAVGAVVAPAEERVTVPRPSQGAPAHWHRRRGVDPSRPSLMA